MVVVDVWVGVVAGIYVAVLSAVVMVCFWSAEERERRALAARADPVRPPTQRLSSYELACIENRFGPGNILGVALVRMHVEQRLTLLGSRHDGYSFRVDDPDPRDEVEAVLLDLLVKERGRLPTSFGPYDLSVPPWRALHERLVTDGLLREPGLPEGITADSPHVSAWRSGRARAYRLRSRLLTGAVTAGAVTALLSELWLLLALHIAALSVLPVFSRPAVPTRTATVTEAGKAAARTARATTTASEDAQALLAVALGGLSALPHWHPFAKPPQDPSPPASSRPTDRVEEPQRIINLDPPGLGGLL
ncbi:TIGR04222 domain-containing membrane protein [Streptomyces cinereoruber]|uniref:TIGR04222 domain-containing membrane protein n=1 Tax=Streptomyces cinereoruber TaxID=67260 RepID=UPI003EBB373B